MKLDVANYCHFKYIFGKGKHNKIFSLSKFITTYWSWDGGKQIFAYCVFIYSFTQNVAKCFKTSFSSLIRLQSSGQ